MRGSWRNLPGHSASEPRLRAVGLRSALAGRFDFAAEPGECIAITGASGSGKTLFLRMLADLDPNEGEVFLEGRERRTFRPAEWRRQVMYCAAEPAWWNDNVGAHFPPDAVPRARGLCARLALPPAMLEARVLGLSTGERQRLALIRALVRSPPVLLLDEPTGALDEKTTALVEAVLRDALAAGMTLLLVSHSAPQAERLANRVVRMEQRRFAG